MRIHLLPLLLFPFMTQAQTVVIGKITQGGIYVAADSRINLVYSNPFRPSLTESSTACKIYHVNKYNFAVVGMGIDFAIKTAHQCCEDARSFSELYRLYINRFSEKLSDTLNNLRQTSPSSYQEYVSSMKPFLAQIVFFGYDDTIPVLHPIFFYLNEGIFLGPSLVNYTQMQPSCKCYGGGHVEEIRDEILSDSTWGNQSESKMTEILNQLIRVEAAKHPAEVAEPIDIIRITRHDFKWIQKKEHCEIGY